MTEPLSPLSPADTNRSHAAIGERDNIYTSPAKRAYRSQNTENIPFDPQLPSSPFVEELSLSEYPSFPNSQPGSPKKGIGRPGASPQRLTEDALRENEGLTRVTNSAIDPSLGLRSPQKVQIREDDTTSTAVGGAHGFAGMDDTCFSAFSAVPNVDMTRFANMDRSPEKTSSRHAMTIHGKEGLTPRPSSRNTPSRSRRDHDEGEYNSPTPRRQKSNRENGGDTTNLLVDFTDPYVTTNTSNRSPTRHGHPSPRKFPTQPDLSTYKSSRRTPSPTKYPLPLGTPNEARHLANLLDFDLPPAPTPRSIPSITARELESMKSRFLSQISSLTATLSGKEAEVCALKDAVTDAERRAGEAQEQIRDERGAKEGLAAEKTEWEKRQGEMQAVLKDVKEEIIRGDREKDALSQRAQEAEHRLEEAELRVMEAESEIEGLRAASTPATGKGGDSTSSGSTNSEVEAAVTKVAKELHGLYKSKHEAKVTALKKSYSDRWERKVRDLSSKVDELAKENEELRIGRDATMSSVIPGHQVAAAAVAADTINGSGEADVDAAKREEAHNAALQSQQQEFTTKLSSLQTELSEVQSTLKTTAAENKGLKTELVASRAEIASLIDASEELMLLSSSALTGSTASSRPGSTEPPPSLQHSQSELSHKSFSRSGSSHSGLQRPGFSGGESKIGRVGGQGLYSTSSAASAASGKERSGANSLGRSGGILSNIERMGRGREG